MKTRHILLAVFLSAACDQAPEEAIEDASASEAEPEAAEAAALEPANASAHALARTPRATMPGAKSAFEEVVKVLGKHYVDGPLSEDELWTGAIEGVMARLEQHPNHPINTLMSPDEVEELVIGTKGRIVGVGVAIERVADVIVVRDIVPGGPAERAGLQAGDRILAIDGVATKGLDLPAIVAKIRGDEGTRVELFMQRETEEWTETLARGAVEFASVEATMMPDGLGYVRITSFAERTAADLDRELAKLQREAAQGLILDLRDCPGGLLEASIAVAERFLPQGARIVSLQGRDGQEKHFDVATAHPSQSTPLVVLVDDQTASSAEILAAAIRDHRRGSIVGEPTMGKGTVESVHELNGGWAVKLTEGRFFSPSGEKRHLTPVTPDLAMPSQEPTTRARIDALDPATDPGLGAAKNLLLARTGR